jgi:hypothetical protein
MTTAAFPFMSSKTTDALIVVDVLSISIDPGFDLCDAVDAGCGGGRELSADFAREREC